MTRRQIKYFLASLGLVTAVFAYATLGGAAGHNVPVSSDAVSAFFSVIVISLLISAQLQGSLQQDLVIVICALAGLVVYTAARSVFLIPSGLSSYLALLTGTMVSAVLHVYIHSLSQNQST